MVEVDLADDRVTLRAAPAMSLGLVWIAAAWLAREVRQSFGYVVALQDVFMNSVLVLGARSLAAEVE